MSIFYNTCVLCERTKWLTSVDFSTDGVAFTNYGQGLFIHHALTCAMNNRLRIRCQKQLRWQSMFNDSSYGNIYTRNLIVNEAVIHMTVCTTIIKVEKQGPISKVIISSAKMQYTLHIFHYWYTWTFPQSIRNAFVLRPWICFSWTMRMSFPHLPVPDK